MSDAMIYFDTDGKGIQVIDGTAADAKLDGQLMRLAGQQQTANAPSPEPAEKARRRRFAVPRGIEGSS